MDNLAVIFQPAMCRCRQIVQTVETLYQRESHQRLSCIVIHDALSTYSPPIII